jgi:hypothetical protein
VIYMIWTMGDELSPDLEAFTNKKDFEQAKKKYEAIMYQYDTGDEYSQQLFRWGFYIVKYSASKKTLCHNITNNILWQNHLAKTTKK